MGACVSLYVCLCAIWYLLQAPQPWSVCIRKATSAIMMTALSFSFPISASPPSLWLCLVLSLHHSSPLTYSQFLLKIKQWKSWSVVALLAMNFSKCTFLLLLCSVHTWGQNVKYYTIWWPPKLECCGKHCIYIRLYCTYMILQNNICNLFLHNTCFIINQHITVLLKLRGDRS